MNTLTIQVQASLNQCPLKIIRCDDRKHALKTMREYKDEWIGSSTELKQVNSIVRNYDESKDPETDAEYHTDDRNHRYCAKFKLCEGQYIYFHFVVPYEVWNFKKIKQIERAKELEQRKVNLDNIYNRSLF